MKSFRVKLLFVAILLFQAFAFSSCDIDDDSFAVIWNDSTETETEKYYITNIEITNNDTKTSQNITKEIPPESSWSVKLDSGTYIFKVTSQNKTIAGAITGDAKTATSYPEHLGTSDTIYVYVNKDAIKVED